jgi:hypothetical protein
MICSFFVCYNLELCGIPRQLNMLTFISFVGFIIALSTSIVESRGLYHVGSGRWCGRPKHDGKLLRERAEGERDDCLAEVPFCEPRPIVPKELKQHNMDTS